MAIWRRTETKSFEPLSAQRAREADGPRMGDLTVGDYANGMPNIRLGEMFKSFFRQLFWVLPLLLIGAAVAWYATEDYKRSYTGDGRILVQLGDEYVYSPIGQTGSGNGLMTTIDTITLTESAIMKNNEIIDQVIGEITAPLIAPDAYEKIVAAENDNDERARSIAWMEMRNQVGDAYFVMPRPKSSIIDVSFRHESPEIAVDATNAFIDAYLSFRRQVFVDGADEAISERRAATEEQLMANERAIARFLKRNDVSDFGSEQTGLRERTEGLKATLNATRASISETEAALARVEDQLRATPETIDLYRDDRAAQRVAQAELELRQLMAKYLPTSDPVRQKQTELEELRSLQASYGGKASGGRRVGPNPTHQALMTQRNNLASTADSLREREFTLQRQLNSADGKIRRLTSLTPEYQNLLRERDTLNVRLTSYNAKEQEALVNSQQAGSAENVKVISRALYPNQGRNMRILMFLLGAAGWGVVLFFIAMIRVFLDPRLYAVPDASRQITGQGDQEFAAIENPPLYDPIPEPVPVYEPALPGGPNPYATPFAPEYAQAAPHYDAQTYAAQPPANMPESGQVEYGYAPAYDGNTAQDLSYNPYASGEVQAGAISDPAVTGYVDNSGYPVQPPYT